jgi:hypothetical protein
MSPSQYLCQLERDIGYLHHEVVTHALFENIVDKANLRCFMEHHVFAVWDFMCLLKALYSQLAGTQRPWLPPLNTEAVYLIGQIMSEEEADIFQDKEITYSSHFEAYCKAMRSCGANTQPIDAFLNALQKGDSLSNALQIPGIPTAARVFVESTFSFFDKPVHHIAASFVFGREGITGDLFSRLLKKHHTGALHLTPEFTYYLQRHVNLDTDSHYPKALRMLKKLCGTDARKWQEATQAAHDALQARHDFWTGIQSAFPTSTPPDQQRYMTDLAA